jgi:hypothetical protein
MTLTMGERGVGLKCDTPGCAAELAHELDHRATPKDTDALRRDAFRAGWSRYRPKSADSLRDYCPACTATLLGRPQ